MIDMLAYVTEKDKVIGWEAVKPAQYASRPPEYLQVLAAENDAWNDRDVLIELQLAGHNVDAELDAIERKINALRTKASRMYYVLNLRPLEVTPEIEIARSDAQDVGL